MLPDRWKLVVIRQTSKQYHAVKEQIFRKDISDIIIATDAGREGELVARWILEKAGNKKPLKRLWISSVTDKAIREGFSHLRPGKDYENLYHAAVARAEADWEVGINATRALTCKYNAQLSCGRGADAHTGNDRFSGRRNQKLYSEAILWTQSSRKRDFIHLDRCKE